jgi:DNA-directed RNA polymerase specialized sigma subunit
MLDTSKSGSVEKLIDEIENAGKHMSLITLMMNLPLKINNLEGAEKQVFILYYMKQSSIEMIMDITNLDEDTVIKTLSTATKKVVDMF